MVTTFVRSVRSRTEGVWPLLDKAAQTYIRLAELDHSSLKRIMSCCSGQVPVYVYASFYRALKLRYPQTSEAFPETAESQLSSAPDL